MEILPFIVAMTGIVLGCGVGFAWAAVEYWTRKQRLTGGASAEELEGMRRDIDAMGEEMRSVQEALADMTLMRSDSVTPQGPHLDDRS